MPHKDLDRILLEAAKQLNWLPPSVDELLKNLDFFESLLVEVEQSPPKAMLNAVMPSMKALVADKLMKHSDIDVKVAVACCISEITRITAPETPYDDEKMKNVFHLIVSSFEDLSNQSSRSYTKRISILETVAKVRLFVVMLDLDCELLIADMFRHFMRGLRNYHPRNVFSSMTTIISLVIEESEDISFDLLSPLLDIFRMEKQDELLVARKLVERVFESCKVKIKPCILKAVESEVISLNEYNDVIVSICGMTCVNSIGDPISLIAQMKEKVFAGSSSHDMPQVEDELLVKSAIHDKPQNEKRTYVSSDNLTQVSKEIVDDTQNKELALDGSLQALKIHGSIKNAGVDPSVVTKLSNKTEIDNHAKEFIDSNEKIAIESLNPAATKEDEKESQTEQSAKRMINMEDDVEKNSDTVDAINIEFADSNKSKMTIGQQSDILDTRKTSKDGSSDLGGTKVVELKLNSEEEETVMRNSKKKDDAEETIKKAVIGDMEGSGVIEPKSKSRHINRKMSKAAPEAKADIDQLIDTKDVTNAESGELNSTEVLKPKPKSVLPVTKRSRKLNSLSTKELSDSTVGCEKEEFPNASKPEELPSEKLDLSQNVHEKFDSIKVTEDDSIKVVSPTHKDVTEGASDSGVRPKRQLGKKTRVGDTNDNKKTTVVGGSGNGGKGKKVDVVDKKNLSENIDKPLLKRKGKTKSGNEKGNSDRDTIRSSSSNDDKDLEKDLAKTPKTSSKRKNSEKGKVSNTTKYDENLIGLKVKVWWPDDAQFYNGVIHDFDSIKKKHKILYDDGDEETLNLIKERWELIEGNSKTLAEEVDEHQRSDDSNEMQQKKKAKTTAAKSTRKRKANVSGGRKSLSSSKVSAAKPGKNSSENDDGEDKSLVLEKSKEPSKRRGRKKGSSSKAGMKYKVEKSGASAGEDTPKTEKEKKQEENSTGKKEGSETMKAAISRKKDNKGSGKEDKKEEAADVEGEGEGEGEEEGKEKMTGRVKKGRGGSSNSNSRKRQKN